MPEPALLQIELFNKLLILERGKTQFAGVRNQSLADGSFIGILESFRPTSGTAPSVTSSWRAIEDLDATEARS
jgi:hypothetical protein